MATKDEINIGANIARLRRELGMTQAELADKLFVSNKAVSKWERGTGYPEITQLIHLSRILGTEIENLLIDDKFGIAVAGNVLVDTVKVIDAYPTKGMLSNILSISQAVGGCACNTAVDLKRIDPSLRVCVYGCVGKDEGGRFLVNELKSEGVDVRGISASDTRSTSLSDVMSVKETGERTFFHHRGANAEFSPSHIRIPTLRCRMLHIGYILLLDVFDREDDEYGTIMARFLKEAQETGIKTSIDIVSDSTGNFRQKVVPALKYTDNAIMNEIESTSISGLPARDANGTLLYDNIRRTMQQIMEYGVRERVIVHCPEAGFCLERNGTYTVRPSFSLEEGYIKGTVGAGDAFCAGCLYSIYNNFDAETMLDFAAGAACFNLSAEDSISGMKDKEQIFQFIENHKA